MIRFQNDSGTGCFTKITNAETGEDLSKVLPIEYGAKIVIDQQVTAECRIAMMQVDMVAGQTAFLALNPVTSCYEPVAALEFRDSSRVEIAADGTPTVKRAPKGDDEVTA